MVKTVKILGGLFALLFLLSVIYSITCEVMGWNDFEQEYQLASDVYWVGNLFDSETDFGPVYARFTHTNRHTQCILIGRCDLEHYQTIVSRYTTGEEPDFRISDSSSISNHFQNTHPLIDKFAAKDNSRQYFGNVKINGRKRHVYTDYSEDGQIIFIRIEHNH